MKIFLSYGHDSNTPLIEKIKEYLEKDAEGNLKHEVWIDTSEIKAGKDWREKIIKGVLESDVVLAGLSQHSTRIPGVCRDEIGISIGVKGGNIRTILLEPSDSVAPPAMISHIQWLDMSDWKKHEDEGFDSKYFQEKFSQIAEMIETPENERFNGEITQLKDALEPIFSISRIKSLTEKEMYGRKWLYEKIEEWDRTSNQRLFWIVAGPGFGKSMFAANLQEQYNARIPAIQFVEWGKPDHSNPCRILMNLAYQLAVRYPEYRKFVLQLPDVINQKMNEKNEDELFDLLFCESTWMKIDGGQENVWVLIDALDEANDEQGNRIAQTLARHMDRMPQWLRFILTSRDDSKVKLPLQKYHPQIFDLEEYVKEKNSEDLLLYVRGELVNFHPTEEQVKQIVDKSQGVFLYLSLCVEGIHNGEYSLEHLDKLPDGLNGYYYEFFNRQFGKDIERYKKDIAPLLQLMVAAKMTLHLSFLKYLFGSSDSKFYEVIESLWHICRITNESNSEVITFFHYSIDNWLTNYKTAGPYYISREDGNIIIANRFLIWLNSKKKEEETVWDTYQYGLFHMAKDHYIIPKDVNRNRLKAVFNNLQYNGGLGGFSKYHSDARDSALDYCKMLLNDGEEDAFLNLMIDFFECVKDDYIKIGLVRSDTRRFKIREIPFNAGDVFQATLNAGSLAFLVRESCKECSVQSYDTIAILLRIIEVLITYNTELCSPYDEIPSIMFYDLADGIVWEMKDVTVILNEIKKHLDLPCLPEDEDSYIGDLYQKALADRHPEWYSYAYTEIEERNRAKEKGEKIVNRVPKGFLGVTLVPRERTPMTGVLEDADKTDSKPEETIYLGNNKVFRVKDWGHWKEADKTDDKSDDLFYLGNNIIVRVKDKWWHWKDIGNGYTLRIQDIFYYYDIGVKYGEKGDCNKALEAYLVAYSIVKKQNLPETQEVAMLFSNIGTTYTQLDKYDYSLEFQKEALRIFKKNLGEDNYYVANSNCNVGQVLSLLGDYKESIRYLTKALDTYSIVIDLKIDDNKLIVSELNTRIGSLYGMLGEHENAIKHFMSAIDIYECDFEKNLNKIAMTYYYMGYSYQQLSNLQNSEYYYSRAIEIANDTDGFDQIVLSKIYNNLGLVCAKGGDLTRGLNYLYESLRIKKLLLGDEHPETIGTQKNIKLFSKTKT